MEEDETIGGDYTFPDKKPSIGEGEYTFDVAKTEKPSSALDIARAVTSQATLGTTTDIYGTPGALAQAYEYVRGLPVKAVVGGASALGLLPEKRSYSEFMKDVNELGNQFRSPAEQKGDVTTIFGLPLATPSGFEKIATEAIPPLGYKGKGETAQKMGKATRFGMSLAMPIGGVSRTAEGIASVPRTLAGMVGRGATGTGVSLGAQELAESAKIYKTFPPSVQQFVEPAATLVGTTAALMLGRSLGSFAAPMKESFSNFSKYVIDDIKNNPAIRENIIRASRTGTPLQLIDAFPQGTATRQYVESLTASSPKLGATLGSHNLTIANKADDLSGRMQRFGDAQTRTSNFIDNIFIGPQGPIVIDTPALQRAQKTAGKNIRDNVYDVARNDPTARDLFPRRIAGPEYMNTNSHVRNVMDKVTELSSSVGGIIPPRYAADGRNISPGNLSFWDEVQRELRKRIEREPKGSIDRRVMESQRNTILQNLDSIVKSYPKARLAAADTFAAENAFDIGTSLFKTKNVVTRDEMIQALGSLNPRQKYLAAMGWLGELKNTIAEGGVGSVANKIKTNVNFRESGERLLGYRFDYIAGKILSEDALVNAKQLVVTPSLGIGKEFVKAGKGAPVVLGVLTTAGSAIKNALIEGAFISPEHLIAGAVPAASAAAAKGYRAAKVRRIADRLAPLIMKDSNEAYSMLYRIYKSNPEAAKMLNNLNLIAQAARTKENPEEGKYMGGRIERKAGGRISPDAHADRLVAAAESAKRRLVEETKPLLNEDDNTIAKALEIANQHV